MKTLLLIILSLTLMSSAHWYEVIETTTTQGKTTVYSNGNTATEVCTNETRLHSRDLNQWDVADIMNKLTVTEYQLLKDYILGESRCIEPKQVTRQEDVEIECTMPAVCGDWIINNNEDCDWGKHCSSDCKIMIIKPLPQPVYEAPKQIVIPNIIQPVWACVWFKCQIQRRLYSY